jgi:phosphate transport system substrate-binding protein
MTFIRKLPGLSVGFSLLITAFASVSAQPSGDRSRDLPRDLIVVAASGPMTATADAISAAFAVQFEAPTPQVSDAAPRSAFADFCRAADSPPDVVFSHRRMSHAELARCRRADAGDIIEIPVGFEVAAFVTRRGAPALDLTIGQLFDLLAANGPRPLRWADEGVPGFGGEVRILLPQRADPAFDIVRENIMLTACRGRPGLGDRPAAASRLAACGAIRDDDGVVTEIDERTIPKSLAGGVIGLVGNSVLQRNAADLQPVLIEGRGPSMLTIASGDYPAARSVFVYAKAAQMRNGRGGGKVRGLRDMANFIASDDITGQNGVLSRLGLIMLPAEQRISVRMRTMALMPFDR